jgi:hypothetical protein
MIPYNTNPGDLPFRRPGWDKARAIAAWLFERGMLTKLRDSAGQDVDGGCGQLRARAAHPGQHRRQPRRFNGRGDEAQQGRMRRDQAVALVQRPVQPPFPERLAQARAQQLQRAAARESLGQHGAA